MSTQGTWLIDYRTAIMTSKLMPYSAVERKVREATRRGPLLEPTPKQLQEVVNFSFNSRDRQIIFDVLGFRLQQPFYKWCNIYKGLYVMEVLLKRGHQDCERIVYSDFHDVLTYLAGEYTYVDKNGKDHETKVRTRAATLLRLSQDSELLESERMKYVQPKQYIGIEGGKVQKTMQTGPQDIPNCQKIVSNNNQHEQDVKQEENKQFRQRGAGECKGVTMKQNEIYLTMLKQLAKKEENRKCADCEGSTGITWASVNCGVFLCMTCAGVHRGLGVHISQVRSITLDTWLPHQVEFLESTGNKLANAYWEAALPQGTKTFANSRQMGEFISKKYTAKKWAEGTWPPQIKSCLQQDSLKYNDTKQTESSVFDSKSSIPDHWVKF